jgi:hypothetical protein
MRCNSVCHWFYCLLIAYTNALLTQIIACCCEHGNEPSASIKGWEFRDQRSVLLSPQGLYSMELVSVSKHCCFTLHNYNICFSDVTLRRSCSLCDGVRLYLCGTGPTMCPLSTLQMIHEFIQSSGKTMLTGKTQRTRRKVCRSATSRMDCPGRQPGSAR